ncbi:Crp/Fnr family transcriptional regulator [Plebeiibacterium sediminum]|uniref:Crp/Fnr family transcriptional regulator n=1 Tax=Plebeiibacterium sediminum TaxID=2992112 RepID=A0AAE3M6R1_9BACT|nr:Crp/Fnr family transcriptional regulator [Plebeiobacterium sediminum]MCW3788149.1 Crp/Fnr family transcriptional regulator [Plebeiobacterium sediminum]
MIHDYPFLEKSPLFRGLTIEEINSAFSDVHYQVKKYSKGQMVVSAGDKVDRLLIVLSGSVKGEMIDFSGKTIKIEDINPPMPLAVAFLFGKSNTFPVNIITNEDSELLVIPKESILKLFQENKMMLLNFLNAISNRSQFLSQKIKFLNFTTIKGKIANYLLQYASQGMLEVVLDKSQNELAELFGVTRPSVGRGIRDLHNEGLIEANGKKIKLIDIQGLKECLK